MRLTQLQKLQNQFQLISTEFRTTLSHSELQQKVSEENYKSLYLS
jgi:hypothetical protein